MDRRQDFLTFFLGALGAESVSYCDVTADFVQGTVIYDATDSSEQQDFRWTLAESDAPSNDVLLLAQLLHEQRLLSIDQVTISRLELQERFNARFGRTLSPLEFADRMDELKLVEVSMLDDGVESDAFFIHE